MSNNVLMAADDLLNHNGAETSKKSAEFHKCIQNTSPSLGGQKEILKE